MYGIESTKDAISFVIEAADKLITIDSNQDGKVKFGEIIGAITGIGFKFPKFYDSLEQVKLEFKDLDDSEIAELVTHFSNEFDLENDKTEELIETALDTLLFNYNAVKKIIDITKS